MGLETATYPNGLNANWPLGTDPKAQGDDHIRLLKTVLKDVFPAGWDDASIADLMRRFRATVSPGQGVGAGTAADVAPTWAKLGQTSNFTGTSSLLFVDTWANIDKTAAGNTVTIDAQVYDETAATVVSSGNLASHGAAATAASVFNAYTPHVSRIIGGLTVGHAYRLELWAIKSVNEGPLPVERWCASAFNI